MLNESDTKKKDNKPSSGAQIDDMILDEPKEEDKSPEDILDKKMTKEQLLQTCEKGKQLHLQHIEQTLGRIYHGDLFFDEDTNKSFEKVE